MNKLVLQLLAGLFAVTLLSTVSIAEVKVRRDEIAQIETVAVVGYSFLRDVQMEEASPFKLKQEVIELKETDPEYIMMQKADDRVMEALQSLGTFSVMPREEVLANEFYQSKTKDPGKKLNLSWYFPKGYRDIKLKKKNAVKLCEALGVNAVVLIHFDSRSSGSESTWGGVYSKKKHVVAMEGEITMFDSSGKELISGGVKSEKMQRGTSRSWGDPDSGIAVETDQDAANMDSFFGTLLDSYLVRLNKDLSET